jgi:hypothetical protein
VFLFSKFKETGEWRRGGCFRTGVALAERESERGQDGGWHWTSGSGQ